MLPSSNGPSHITRPTSCVALVVHHGPPQDRHQQATAEAEKGAPGCLTQPPVALGACNGARCQAVHSDVVGSPLHSKVTGHGIWERITTGIRKGKQSQSRNFLGAKKPQETLAKSKEPSGREEPHPKLRHLVTTLIHIHLSHGHLPIPIFGKNRLPYWPHTARRAPARSV